jgi:GPH family glycoside/pentoside/hexuronide:cation symporter
LLTGVMLQQSGFDVDLAGEQSPSTLYRLRVFDVGVPLITSAAAILIMWGYQLTEQKMHEVRTQLEQRRGKLASPAEPV